VTTMECLFQRMWREPNSEYYRALGLVDLRSGSLNRATKSFMLSGLCLAEESITYTEAQIAHQADRQIAVTLPASDAVELAANTNRIVVETNGRDSMHGIVNATWASASWLMSDSPEWQNRALDELGTNFRLSEGALQDHQLSTAVALYLLGQFELAEEKVKALVPTFLYANFISRH
jgi:hypothetical protein